DEQRDDKAEGEAEERVDHGVLQGHRDDVREHARGDVDAAEGIDERRPVGEDRDEDRRTTR
ncbi:hypothetical protein CSW77_26695, partial [Shigella flexneri]